MFLKFSKLKKYFSQCPTPEDTSKHPFFLPSKPVTPYKCCGQNTKTSLEAHVVCCFASHPREMSRQQVPFPHQSTVKYYAHVLVLTFRPSHESQDRKETTTTSSPPPLPLVGMAYDHCYCVTMVLHSACVMCILLCHWIMLGSRGEEEENS